MSLSNWYAQGAFTMYKRYRIFYTRNGSGPILLCIHGFPSSSWDFARIWKQLADHFRVIAPDLIGLGRSSKPKKVSVSLQADMIEELLVSLDVRDAHILAHDLGDTVAQELLARQNEGSNKVNWLSCVFMNGGIFPETHRPLLTQRLLASPLGQLLVKTMSQQILAKSFKNIFSKEHPPRDQFIEDTWQLIIHDNGRSMIPRLIKYMKERSLQRERWVEPLEKNIVPIRLINGLQDPISGAHAAIRFEEVVPNADVCRIEDAGHYPHIETPEKVIEYFFAFHNL